MRPVRVARWVSAIALVAISGAVVAGCGGDDDAPMVRLDAGFRRDGGGDDGGGDDGGGGDPPDAGRDAAIPPGCGDGVRSAFEACDDGDLDPGDGCSPFCEVERGFSCLGSPSVCRSRCGDGVIAADEVCDDGNTAPLDGCNGACGLEAGWSCSGEPSECIETCGDGVIDGADGCDDANVAAGDGCSPFCQVESGWECGGVPSTCAPLCGDGLVLGGEACDDGGTTGGDGCSATCTIEGGWSCEGMPSVCDAGCGDGEVRGSEPCDDGDVDDGDGCSGMCRVEVGWSCAGSPSACAPICGDGVAIAGEQCDDGDAEAGDGCSATCTVERGFSCVGAAPSACSTTCGDGIVAGAETCDDGALVSGDGCDATCQVEFAYACTGEPSSCLRVDHAVSVALGDRSGCALTERGFVRCWGENVRGAVGDGSTQPRFLPVTALDRAVDLDVGGLYACALRDDTTVWCWGSDSSQQQGPGVTASTRPTPGPVAGLIDVVAITTGQEHACALDDEGAVWCWGDNDRLQLGRGGTDNTDSEVPTVVMIGQPAVQVSAGGDHTCAVREDTAVVCWGDDDQGQLGDGGTNTAQSLPVAAIGLTGAVEVAAGFDHTCARTATGEVWCWGDGQQGQLGTATMTDRSTPVAITLPGPATAITAGKYHTCALVDGAAYCWGDGVYGQIGDGIRGDALSPVAVDQGGARFLQIDAGEFGTCAITEDGARRCWGQGELGQLGTLAPAQRDPLAVAVLGEISILAGTRPDRFAAWCAVSEGLLSCWGNSESGLWSDPTDLLVPRALPPLEGVLGLGLGEDFGCVWTASGVSCWGDNSQRQLGQAMSVMDSLAPLPVMGLPAPQVEIAVGRQFACARDGAGAVRCWGDSASRQVGLDATTDSGVATLIPGVAGATAIAAGEGHACAIVAAGEVRCWGDDASGQLGDGSPGGARPDAQVVGELGPATQIALGRDHSCALLTSGRVACWGENGLGQVGDGGTTDRSAPREVVGLMDVVQIAAGWEHTCARRSDGSVACWGGGADGQLGAGFTATSTTSYAAAPVELAGVTGATDVAASASATCVRDAGGVRCLGFHGYGQLGNGTTLRPLVPTGAPL